MKELKWRRTTSCSREITTATKGKVKSTADIRVLKTRQRLELQRIPEEEIAFYNKVKLSVTKTVYCVSSNLLEFWKDRFERSEMTRRCVFLLICFSLVLLEQEHSSINRFSLIEGSRVLCIKFKRLANIVSPLKKKWNIALQIYPFLGLFSLYARVALCEIIRK